uniref:Uncharacterized protein n=1 Tax=Romanomermis culicivorax TaxID=13658 RepID=A0A915II54_ROMCU
KTCLRIFFCFSAHPPFGKSQRTPLEDSCSVFDPSPKITLLFQIFSLKKQDLGKNDGQNRQKLARKSNFSAGCRYPSQMKFKDGCQKNFCRQKLMKLRNLCLSFNLLFLSESISAILRRTTDGKLQPNGTEISVPLRSVDCIPFRRKRQMTL